MYLVLSSLEMIEFAVALLFQMPMEALIPRLASGGSWYCPYFLIDAFELFAFV